MFGKRYTDECFIVKARVAELVDAPDSKSGASDGVRVQVPPLAPLKSIKTYKLNLNLLDYLEYQFLDFHRLPK